MQMNMFNDKNKFIIDKPIRLIELDDLEIIISSNRHIITTDKKKHTGKW